MDSLCFKAGIQAAGLSLPISVAGGVEGRSHPAHFCALGRATSSNGISLENSTVTAAPPPRRLSLSSRFSFTYPFVSLWPSAGIGEPNGGAARDDAVVDVGNGGDRQVDAGGGDHNGDGNGKEDETLTSGDKPESWALKILHGWSFWSEQGNSEVEKLGVREENADEDAVSSRSGGCCCCHDGDSGVCSVDEGGEEEKEEQAERQEIKFDRDSFSRLLRRVSLAETKFYAQMSYLGNLAYSIPQIKPGILLKYCGLRFVTSSLEKKMQSKNVEKEETIAQVQETERPEEASEAEEQIKKNEHQISASAAYQIAASAASYLHSQTKSILPFKSTKAETEEDSPRDGGATGNIEITSSEVASFVETTNSLTAVVAAEEETKQAVAKKLNSAHSSPCEWFICDDDQSETRFFVIQGSESLASWQTNLLFEPIQFEGLDVPVHRGIYEAAKGMYEQMLPEVHAHLKSCGDSATFRFTGHSLGGSLSLLISLMLLIRGEVPQSSLLPLITFGAPSIMCGGDQLLHKLGLPRSYVKAITMHRDIVPRAFSCNYPDRVAELLKAVNANFRNHPCLNNQKMLYGPMGELLILQPEEKFSPQHHLLPSGSGLYLLQGPMSDSCDAEKQLWAAQNVFLNSPHPLEILSDRSAYGSDGTIYRDHDMNSYFKSVRNVIRHELNLIRKAKREHRRKIWWPLVASHSILAGIIMDNHVASGYMGQHQPNLSGIFRNGRRTLKRFSRLIASHHMPLILVLLFPVRLLLLGTYTLINFR